MEEGPVAVAQVAGAPSERLYDQPRRGDAGQPSHPRSPIARQPLPVVQRVEPLLVTTRERWPKDELACAALSAQTFQTCYSLHIAQWVHRISAVSCTAVCLCDIRSFPMCEPRPKHGDGPKSEAGYGLHSCAVGRV